LYEVSKLSTWSEDDARQAFDDVLFGNRSALKAVGNEWMALDDTEKQKWLDAADVNNDGVDDDERQNAIENYAWDKRKYIFMDMRGGGIRERSVSAQKQEAAQAADPLTMNIANLISQKRGISAEESSTGHGWSVGDKAITFTSKATTPKERGVWVSVSDIGALPKNATVSGGQVYARPDQVLKDGTVVWNVAGKNLKEITGKDAQEIARLRMEVGRDADNLIEKDGKIYEIMGKEELGIETTSTWDQSKDRLTALFPRIDEAWGHLTAQGWGKQGVPLTKDGKIDIMNIQ
jgi:hypothetical protein